jgi:hypothetical protein
VRRLFPHAVLASRCTDDEHGTLRGQIEQLKTGLEHEQMLRRRKMEYDFVAEKVNTLPTREELEQCVVSAPHNWLRTLI